MSKMIQVSLSHKLAKDGVATMTTWVDYSPMIKEGASVKLKDFDYWWNVDQVHSELDRETVTANRNWDNNNYDKHESSSFKSRATR